MFKSRNTYHQKAVAVIARSARPLLAALMLSFVAFSGTSISARVASEQVVFSGVGFFGEGSPIEGSPFGFWVWCEAESENPYAGRCNGAMYIYALGITKHVDGTILEIGTDEQKQYTMTLASRDHAIEAMLTNISPLPPAKGPRNTVDGMFSSPKVGPAMIPVGNGTSTNAVVKVTGP